VTGSDTPPTPTGQARGLKGHDEKRLTMAVPRGRTLGEIVALLARLDIMPEPEFDDPETRRLHFATNDPRLELIRVRAFDVATFVAFGAAQLGIASNDVLMEFDYSEIYAPLDLNLGHCRLAVAALADRVDADGTADVARRSHIRVATKYPEITRRHFAGRGVQAECIRLNGAIELAPRLGLCRHIVDLVETGATLRANGLVEVERIAAVSSRLIVNRPAMKTRSQEIGAWIDRFRAAVVERPRAVSREAAG
jgi:ATP phosphoribosyltransferase